MNKVLLAGGGTGGHIMPAIALADILKEKGYEILFVGSKDRMEAKLVPDHGYEIKFIWISAFHRSLRVSNLIFPLKLITALIQSHLIVRKFKPNFVIGTGGFASGPILYASAKNNFPIFLQEQNSYPGITTRLLEKYAKTIFIAYDRTRTYLKSKNTKLFGNPIRVFNIAKLNRLETLEKLKLKNNITLSIIGGSQGALSINKAFSKIINTITSEHKLNVIWQSGKYSYEQFKHFESDQVRVKDYIHNMEEIYAVSDIIICRAGAISLSEIAQLGKATIVVPLKSAAANHQFHNAKAFADKEAAILIEDNENLDKEIDKAIQNLLTDETLRKTLGKNIQEFAMKDAAKNIVNEILATMKN